MSYTRRGFIATLSALVAAPLSRMLPAMLPAMVPARLYPYLQLTNDAQTWVCVHSDQDLITIYVDGTPHYFEHLNLKVRTVQYLQAPREVSNRVVAPLD